jgi:bifunctional DNA-binding transcriptional regulator/antitoxin component of YhaV-PrlF toxin-antitoxin module
MIHPSETDTADVNEFGAVRIPEEILRKLGAGVGDLISFVKDGDSIRLVVKKQKSIQEDQAKESPGLTKPFRIPTMQFVTE